MNRGKFTPIATRRPPLLGRRRRGDTPSPWVALFHLVLTVVLLWGLLWGVLLGWRVSIPPDVKIPEVVGMGLPAAEEMLRQARLGSEVVAREHSDEAEEDTILVADPAPGRVVKVGRKVTLTVSLGSAWTKVPDVKQMSVARAKELLLSRALRPGREEADFDEKAPAGYVIDQSPAAGTKLTKESFVHLLISKGKKPPEVGGGEGPGGPGTGLRSAEVSVVVPPGAELQEVRIVVEDEGGERTIYEGFHQPGDIIAKTASGRGGKVIVRVYVSGELTEEREL